MKIFVAYGFTERNRWIVDMVFPIIRAFGDEVVSGKAMYGDSISEEDKRRIRNSNACIGFLTQDPKAKRGRTHDWVADELVIAESSNLRIVEVREKGVANRRGVLAGRSHITYDEKRRDECLVALVETLGNWHKESDVRLQLLPEKCVQDLFPLHRKEGLRCSYRLHVDGQAGPDVLTKIEPIKQGLFVAAKNVPKEALVQVQIEYENRSWTSSFESVDSISIALKEN